MILHCPAMRKGIDYTAPTPPLELENQSYTHDFETNELIDLYEIGIIRSL